MLDVGLRNARGIGGGTEFEQLREYTVDDEFRRVDWAASARVGRPIVRSYRPERNQNVLILMDNGRLSAAQTGGYPRLEHNIDAAIMLGEVATRLGDRVGMVTFDREVRSVVPLSRRSDQVSRLTGGPVRSASRCWPRATTSGRSPTPWPGSVDGCSSSCSPS